MRWRKQPRHRLIALIDARRLTGLEAADLLRRTDTQKLIRIDESGRREELLRVPIGLLIQTHEQERFA